MKNKLKKTVGIILCLIMLMQVAAFAAGAPENVRWVTGMDLGWNTNDDKWIAWDLVPGCDIYVLYIYKDNAFVDCWFSERDPDYDDLSYESVEGTMRTYGTGSYTVKVGAYSGDENDINSYDCNEPNMPVYGISEMSAPYNYVGSGASSAENNGTTSVPAEPEKTEPAKETPVEEPVTGRRTKFDYAENAEIECPLAVKVCHDLGILPNVYDDAKKFVTYDEFLNLWEKNFNPNRYNENSEPQSEENIYATTLNSIIAGTLFPGVSGQLPLYPSLTTYNRFTEVTYAQLAKIIYDALLVSIPATGGYNRDENGVRRFYPDLIYTLPNGLLIKFGYDKYIADVTVSGGKATVTGIHYSFEEPNGEKVSDTILTIADGDLKADAKDMILFVKDGAIVSAVPNKAAKEEKSTKDYTLPFTLSLKIGDKSASIRDYSFAADAAPKIVNGRTMLPIRLVAEKLGASISWDGSTETVTIIKDKKKIDIVIGGNNAKVWDPWVNDFVSDSHLLPLDAPAFIEDGRTYLPVRFVAENLGASVTWDGDTQTVTIKREDN